MKIYMRVIVGKHCLERLVSRLNDICNQHEMVFGKKIKVYWKDENCYEMAICLSRCRCMTFDEWSSLYCSVFRQPYSIEDTGDETVTLLYYALLQELDDPNVEKYFVLMHIPKKCILDYNGRKNS